MYIYMLRKATKKTSGKNIIKKMRHILLLVLFKY
jgi:hypothetical protein